jgi:hypothetical protein
MNNSSRRLKEVIRYGYKADHTFRDRVLTKLIYITHKFLGPLERKIFQIKSYFPDKELPPLSPHIALIGIYNSEKKNFSKILREIFSTAQGLRLDQYWVKIGQGKEIQGDYCAFQNGKKFEILDILLKYGVNLELYDYIVITDDDILPDKYMLYRLIEGMISFDLALAQPARSFASEVSHVITRRQSFRRSVRLTNFVEIGPLFAIRRDLLNHILIYDPTSPMGFGYDYIWSKQVENIGLKMGIVDSASINHGARKTGRDYSCQGEEMDRLLKKYMLERFENDSDSPSV